MSTFGGLNTAYSGLVAARAALEVTAQNVSNASTAGYSRQRVDQSANVQAATATYTTNQSVGDGVTVNGVSRITDAIVNAQVNTTSATSAYWDASSSAISTVETSLNEPSTTGLSSQLSAFWNAWQSMGNSVGSSSASTTAAAASVLIGAGQDVASTISTGYSAVAGAWSDQRSALATNISTINSTATQIAGLNQQISVLTASGGNANALLDQRDAAVTTLAGLTGATTRTNSNGTIDVLVGGNTLVSGTQARQLQLASTSATDISDVSTNPVGVVWSDTGTAASIDGGTVAAQLTSLSAANASGTGGTYAEAAKVYNDLAASVADQVNTLTQQGQSSSGATNLAFFSYTAGSAASTLAVVPTDVTGIATASTTGGTSDASVADAVSQLGTAASAPDSAWATYVSRVGSQSASAASRSTSADTAAAAATSAQTSTSGVDLDEETSNLVIYQHAYQASARVISTINDILDTLMQMGTT